MGIEHQDVRALFRALKRNGLKRDGRLLILGDAVIHFRYPHLSSIAREFGEELLRVSDDLTPYLLGEALGFDSVDTLDINGKATITLDLQQELPQYLLGRYDMVIDAGVLFWCFDPGLVLKNILRLLKPGGIAFHITAVTGYFGRGYYNIHPRLFEDFYLGNRCIFLQSSFRTKPRASLLERIWRFKTRLFSIEDGSEFGVCYVDTTEKVFLGAASRISIQFEKKLKYPEAQTIPNNVIGTFAFRKTTFDRIDEPIQTS